MSRRGSQGKNAFFQIFSAESPSTSSSDFDPTSQNFEPWSLTPRFLGGQTRFFSKVLEFFLQGLGVLSPRSWSLFSKVLEFYLQGLGVLSPSLWSYNSKTLEFYLQDLGVTTPHPFSPLAAPPGAPRARGEGRAHQSTSNWSTVIRPAILEGGVGAQGMCVGVFGGSVWRKKSVWGRREGQLWACAQD